MKRIVFLILVMSVVLPGQSQESTDFNFQHYKTAINLLQQSKKGLPADSMLFQNEIERLNAVYTEWADSLRSHNGKQAYIEFETQRLINFFYNSESIQEVKQHQQELFEHVARHCNYFVDKDSLNNEIAKCIVSAYETHDIWFEDTLILYVTTAMEQHMRSLYAGFMIPVQEQEFVDMYASQYYKRGIISLAEPVFRHFREAWQYEPVSMNDRLVLSEDYPLLSSVLSPAGQDLSRFISGRSIIIIPRKQSPFDLVYLIIQLRTIERSYPGIPVFLLRDTSVVNNDYLLALSRNLSSHHYYVVNLSENDIKFASDYSTYSFQSEDGSVVFSGNHPIDFLEWLEKPQAGVMKKQKEQLLLNYKKLKAAKDSIAGLSVNDTLKYAVEYENVKLYFKGYWNTQPEVSFKYWWFTRPECDGALQPGQMATLQVNLNGAPVYMLNFFLQPGQIEISLMADPQHKISVSFADSLNQQWYHAQLLQDSLLGKQNAYKNLLGRYPFGQSDFMKKIEQRSAGLKYQMGQNYQHLTKPMSMLLRTKQHISEMYNLSSDSMLTYDDFKTCFPTQGFDSVIWYSPYYKAWVDAWLLYGGEDMENAVNLLYGSWKTMPDTAGTVVGEYLWDQMNSMGRFDIMVHLDTSWLANCSDSRNVDVMKRVEGYKRMSPGKKAPNFTWEEQGESMDLYSIKADTTIVVFWSADCPHCQRVLPLMYDKLAGNLNIAVIAIAVDVDNSSVKMGERYMPAWHHVQLDSGWNDELIELYNVYGTPEMYILNSNQMIIRKALDF